VDRRSFTDILLGSQPRAKSAEDSRASLRVPDGFAVELVASEPLVKSPVAIDWGPDGKMWVVEMIDYPLGMDGKWKSGGRICYLEDTNGSGHYEKCTDFLDGVNFPNQVMPWRKGVLVSAAPDIFYAEDSTGQGKADIRRVILSGFNQYNPQHRVNGFEYGLDNWVYAANGGSDGVIQSPQSGQKMDIHGHDLAFNPDSGVFRLEPGETQYGRHRDDWGNWFGNNNSDWGWHFYLPEHYVLRNPFLTLAGLTTDLANYPNQNRVYTIAPLLERFNWPDQIFELTSACSFIPYRDDLFGPEFSNSVFICEPANNVVHREVLEQNGATFSSHRAPGEEKTEFAASTDNWFRPTMAKTGPDGALYIVDMYRLVIEHPAYFPEELRHRPDLRAGDDMGRIYRIFPKGAHLRPIPRLDKMSTAELAAALDDSNGWQRDMAQRLLVQSGDPAAIPLLSTLLRSNARAKTRLQALAALDGLGAATPEILLDAFSDADPHVRSHAVRLAEPFVEKYPAVGEALLKLTEDSDVPVRFQLAFSLGEWNSAAAGRALGKMALNDFEQPQIRTAIMSSATNRIEDISGEVFAGLPDHPPEDALAEQLTSLAAALGKNQALARPIQEAGKPLAAGTASWQLAIGLGLLDGLNQRGVTLADFALAGGDEIKKGLAGLNGIFQQTGVIARNEKLSPAERSLAVRMLAHASAGQDQSIEALGQLLEPAVAPELQEAALDGLKQFHSPHAALVLIGGWRGYSPELRAGVLNALFSRKEWTGELLNAIENKKIQAANLSTTHKQKLLAYSDPAIRERAAKLFARTNADRQRVVKEYQDALELTGNPVHGHELFRANCVLCHRLNGEGNFVGPELGTVVDKPASELLVSILDPNQTVEVTYVAYTAVTADDRELTGVIGSETPNSIVLRLPGGTRETILRKDLKEFKSMGLSLMPEGFETALKKQDLADLIAYITHGASAAKSASRN
jgi:putative membrane-bound dehydrogenase-like protein